MEKTLLNLEHQIAAFVNADNKSGCTVHFDYTEDRFAQTKGSPSSEWTATVNTFNPTTEETFMLGREIAPTKEKALKAILDRLKKQKGENPFTVKWAKKGDAGMKDSYFYCHDVLDVVERFFNGKNPEDYVVYEIKLNPIA